MNPKHVFGCFVLKQIMIYDMFSGCGFDVVSCFHGHHAICKQGLQKLHCLSKWLTDKVLITLSHSLWQSLKIEQKVFCFCVHVDWLRTWTSCSLFDVKVFISQMWHTHMLARPPAGYYGDLCENAMNACDSSPCVNNGTCNATGPSSYTCACPSGEGLDLLDRSCTLLKMTG